jgi:hypothetical protein
MMNIPSSAFNLHAASGNKNSTDLTDLNAGHFWVVKDGTKYYLNLTDLKDYYLDNKKLKYIKVWDGSKYVQNPNMFSGFNTFAQDNSFAGLVGHVTNKNKSDFEKGHKWVQALPSNAASPYNTSAFITDDPSCFFNEKTDKKLLTNFANNIITLFEQSKKQIGKRSFDHNHQRVSRYLYTLSRLAAFVPKLWNTFIQTHGEWIQEQASYKDHYKQSFEFGNSAIKVSPNNAAPIANQALAKATIPPLHQPITSSAPQKIDIKGAGALNKVGEANQIQPIANANEQKKQDSILINTSLKQAEADEKQKQLCNSQSKIDLKGLNGVNKSKADASKLNDGSSIPSAKIQLPTYTLPEFFTNAIKHIVQKINKEILPSINKDTIDILQGNSASNYDKYNEMKKVDNTIDKKFINRCEFKVAESHNHWGKIRISLGYKADGTENLTSKEALALQKILKAQKIDVFNADKPAYNNCIYINPKDLEKAWKVLKDQNLSPYSANHDAYGNATTRTFKEEHYTNRNFTEKDFADAVNKLYTLDLKSKNANAGRAAQSHR